VWPEVALTTGTIGVECGIVKSLLLDVDSWIPFRDVRPWGSNLVLAFHMTIKHYSRVSTAIHLSASEMQWLNRRSLTNAEFTILGLGARHGVVQAHDNSNWAMPGEEKTTEACICCGD
jgi:hypothetical protein